MRRVARGIALGIVLAVAPLAQAQTATIPVTVVVHGLRNDHGHVRIGLYSDTARWTHEAGIRARCVARPHAGEASCVLAAPGPGRYAFAILVDEDDDQRMRKDALGLPQEGYGFSNDVRGGLSAPSFGSASFNVGGPMRMTVTARYGI